MAGLGGLVLLLGYQNLYFGLTQLAGGNDGYWSLLIPGRYTAQPNDKTAAAGIGGSGSTGVAGAGSALAGGAKGAVTSIGSALQHPTPASIAQGVAQAQYTTGQSVLSAIGRYLKGI